MLQSGFMAWAHVLADAHTKNVSMNRAVSMSFLKPPYFLLDRTLYMVRLFLPCRNCLMDVDTLMCVMCKKVV